MSVYSELPMARLLSFLLALTAFIAKSQTPCGELKSLSLVNSKITAAEDVPAGPLPAHCRVAAVLTPSSDSHIEMEVWLPSEGWNGKFLAVGNGGWAGNIEKGAMATALSRGYATASNDTGHKGGSA